METELHQWKNATAKIKWGEQQAFIDVLTLAENGKSKTPLVWGADYRDKGACLVNKAASMLLQGGGHGVPSATFGEVVRWFDETNRMFLKKGINTDHNVSPMAAEILLRWFGPLKEKPAPKADLPTDADGEIDATFFEPSDEEMSADLLKMFTTPAPTVDTTPPLGDPSKIVDDIEASILNSYETSEDN